MPRLLALLLLTAGIRSAPVCAQQRHGTHSTYVIVHGAWGGGWDWRAVDSMLTLRGNRVVRVTLTGLGERVHLASPTIGLSTHIDDVVNTILWEDLHDVVLVGHSYGGIVITGVVDRIPDRIRRLVYLDAFLPDSGETTLALADSIGATFVRSNIREGFIIPSWVTDDHAIPRDVPQPLRTFTDTLRLVNAAARHILATYILTFEPTVTPDPFQRFADRAAARGWPVYRMQANHTPERSARVALVALLQRVP
ncbi:MAG: alpha/beta hydrolase [Gemmatimonadetes bacterium]|nr:MAG: alpha/beta hydrolase [Gemmatimonadota bacterium]PYP23487.1 MAG: alpha/beta hydrolase [Gemmatimonadota bacterium]